MKRFLVLAYQGNGCDYTIGCGIAFKFFNAETPEEAFNKWADSRDLNLPDEPEIGKYYLPGGEGELQWIKVLEVGPDDNEHLWEEFVGKKFQQIEDAKAAAKEAAERAEFERLQAKFKK